MNDDFWQLLAHETLFFVKKDFIKLPKNEIDFEGSFEQGVLIGYYGSLSEADKSLLANILKSVKLTYNDIAFVNFDTRKDLSIAEIQQLFEAKTTIVFGASEGQTLYQIQKEDESVQFLYAHELNAFHNSPAKKKDFWRCLKDLFLI